MAPGALPPVSFRTSKIQIGRASRLSLSFNNHRLRQLAEHVADAGRLTDDLRIAGPVTQLELQLLVPGADEIPGPVRLGRLAGQCADGLIVRLNSQNEGMASSSPPRGRLLAMAGRRVR